MVLDAIFYLVRGGIAWRALPADFPPHQTVDALFRRWTRACGAGSTQRCVNVRVLAVSSAAPVKRLFRNVVDDNSFALESAVPGDLSAERTRRRAQSPYRALTWVSPLIGFLDAIAASAARPQASSMTSRPPSA
ncbi:transposase [Nocardia sp. CWNU-33]|uniref:transposase n=1 Tax=Nocardia sp. CWNU-33 TaxID=3392117 RepID=UPI00398E8771